MRTERVVVGMSGGVDSSSAAAILLRAGYHVVGVTMRVWSGAGFSATGDGPHGCYGPSEAQDIEDARRVAKTLGIEFVEVDLVEEYGRTVLDYVRTQYAAGRTPNPCARCNPRMKFGFLWDRVQQMGIEADYFATGHYARTGIDLTTGRVLLRKGVDVAKDQSYFLAFLSSAQLARSLFPLGDLQKSEVRTLAHSWGLPVSDKRDSQDFVEGGASLVLGQAGQPGPILDQAGKQLGEHRGIAHYTVGQRKGLGIPARERTYVIQIDALRNAIVVGPRHGLLRDSLTASGLNWISVDAPAQSLRAKAKLRSQHVEADATVVPLAEGLVRVTFDTAQFGVAPGQVIVFYRDDIVLGAGTIEA